MPLSDLSCDCLKDVKDHYYFNDTDLTAMGLGKDKCSTGRQVENEGFSLALVPHNSTLKMTPLGRIVSTNWFSKNTYAQHKVLEAFCLYTDQSKKGVHLLN